MQKFYLTQNYNINYPIKLIFQLVLNYDNFYTNINYEINIEKWQKLNWQTKY